MILNRRSSRPRRRRLLGVLLATSAVLTSGGPALTQPYGPDSSVRDVLADATGYGGQLSLPNGGSRILRFNQPIGRVMLGNPKVGDVIPLGERTLYVLGKSAGATTLTVMPRVGGAPLATLDVRVNYDIDNIRRSARDVLPGEQLEVSARGDGVVLTGVLSSAAAAARAAALAEQYAPGHVVNLTTIRSAEQVMLSVRVAEVQRTALQQLGLNNLKALWDTTGAFTIAPEAANSEAVVNLLGRATSGDWTFQALFDALEQKGFASTLAEPNLVALSGETAVFFAGGEYPIPVPQTGAGLTNTITIEYKQYGVSIGFTPTVYGDSINLAVAPEVSALDPANSIVLQGFRIPGITTRRAKTTVELRNGQSFAIAGLIRREFTDSVRGVPGAQRVPLVGALLRSTSYQNNETEVVIIVTAHMAKPGDRRALLAPTDLRRGPGEAEQLITGVTDVPIAPSRPSYVPPPPPVGPQSAAPNASSLAWNAETVSPPAAPAPAAGVAAPAPQSAPRQAEPVAPSAIAAPATPVLAPTSRPAAPPTPQIAMAAPPVVATAAAPPKPVATATAQATLAAKPVAPSPAPSSSPAASPPAMARPPAMAEPSAAPITTGRLQIAAAAPTAPAAPREPVTSKAPAAPPASNASPAAPATARR